MSRSDNPPYVTVSKLFDVYHVNLMEWDERADDYQVTISKQLKPFIREIEAHTEARQWATNHGYEFRV